MKYLKLSIVLLVVVAFVVGIVVLVNTKKADQTIDLKKSSVKEQTVEKDIKEKIENAPNSSFCVQAYNDILSEINLFFKDEPTNKKTYTTNLQRAYTGKFVQQAMYVFEHNQWRSSDIAIIRREYKNCLSFSPNNPDLPVLNTILKDYDKLLAFDKEVTNACAQKPRKSVYEDEDWNVAKTNSLLNSIPTINTKAKNSPAYTKTRGAEVEKRLKAAHKKFVEERICQGERVARRGIDSHHYGEMSSQLFKNCNTYHRMWNEDVSNWKDRIRECEPLDF